jgi:hypothetical protein
MIEADVFLCKREDFYNVPRKVFEPDTAAYECLYEILKRFKESFSLKIHTMHTNSNEDSLQINFKGSYMLTFNRYGERVMAKLYYDGSNIDEFKKKFEKLEEIIQQIY